MTITAITKMNAPKATFPMLLNPVAISFGAIPAIYQKMPATRPSTIIKNITKNALSAPLLIQFSLNKLIFYATFKLYLWVLSVRLLLKDLASMSIFPERIQYQHKCNNSSVTTLYDTEPKTVIFI